MMVSHGEDAIKLIREMVKQRFEPKAIISPGSPGMYEAQFYRTLGKYGDYAITNLPWINPRSPLSKTLLAAFSKQFPDALFEMNIGFTFEAILVAADAARRAGGAASKALLDALPLTNLAEHVMIGGPIAFDAKGQNNNIHSAAVQNRDSKPVVVLPAENADRAPILPAPGWQQRG
jgi:branched-chain amino acid transport system substrate-binding protein